MKKLSKIVIDDEENQANLHGQNFMPKGVKTLEGLYDLNNKFRKPTNVKTNSSSMQYELINLGTEAEPTVCKLGKMLFTRRKKQIYQFVSAI